MCLSVRVCVCVCVAFARLHVLSRLRSLEASPRDGKITVTGLVKHCQPSKSPYMACLCLSMVSLVHGEMMGNEWEMQMC